MRKMLLCTFLLFAFVGGTLPVCAQRPRSPKQTLTRVRARSGESLNTMAARFNVSVEDLVSINGGSPAELLPVGAEISIPQQAGKRLTRPVVATQPRMVLLPPEQFPAGGDLQARSSFLFPYIVSAAVRNGIDPRLLWVICYNETRFQPNKTSPKGAQGLTQMMPGTAARFGVTNPMDFRQSLDGSAKYLRYLTRLFNGNLVHILGGYNAGEGAVLAYLRGGSYVGGSGTRYYVTPQSKGFGTGIPQNSETINYVIQGVQLFNSLTQARVFDSFINQPANTAVLAQNDVRPSLQNATPEVAADRPVAATEAAKYVPTSSFYFGEDGDDEGAQGAGNTEGVKAEAETSSYNFP